MGIDPSGDPGCPPTWRQAGIRDPGPDEGGVAGVEREQSYRRIELDSIGAVESWEELTDVKIPLVSFRSVLVFENDGAVLSFNSTLCFRDRDEIADSLRAADLVVEDIRDAPDRPGREFVFIAAND